MTVNHITQFLRRLLGDDPGMNLVFVASTFGGFIAEQYGREEAEELTTLLGNLVAEYRATLVDEPTPKEH